MYIRLRAKDGSIVIKEGHFRQTDTCLDGETLRLLARNIRNQQLEVWPGEPPASEGLTRIGGASLRWKINHPDDTGAVDIEVRQDFAIA